MPNVLKEIISQPYPIDLLLYFEECGYKLWDFQFYDITRIIASQEFMLNWGRGFSKTWIDSFISVFAAIKGFKCAYRCAGEDQLDQPMEYWYENPFVSQIHDNWINVCGRKGINADVLTEKTIRSKRFDWNFYDEMAQLIHNPAQQKLIPVSYGMLRGSIYAKKTWTSTPVTGSYYHKVHNRLKPQGLVSHRNFQNTSNPRISVDQIMKERDEAVEMGMLWLWEQENLALFTVPNEPILPNVIFEDFAYQKPTSLGVDFHGDYGSIALECYKGNRVEDVWMMGEHRYPNIGVLDLSWLSTFDCLKKVESGGFNEGFAREAKRYGADGCGITPQDKAHRLVNAKKWKIHVNPKLTPYLYNDILNLMWKDPVKLVILKDETHPNHYFDAMLLALPEYDGARFNIPQRRKYEPDIIAQERERDARLKYVMTG